MSHDIQLNDPNTDQCLILDEPHLMRGGNYQIGGEQYAYLNVTYNYTDIFRRVIGGKGITTIYGKSGAESVPILESAIALLGDDVNPDYWKATEGNVKRALIHLLALAQMRPDGVWVGD